MRELLFKVVRHSDGHEYKIFTDGSIEGFSDDCWISNWWPNLYRAKIEESRERVTWSNLSPAVASRMEQELKALGK